MHDGLIMINHVQHFNAIAVCESEMQWEMVILASFLNQNNNYKSQSITNIVVIFCVIDSTKIHLVIKRRLFLCTLLLIILTSLMKQLVKSNLEWKQNKQPNKLLGQTYEKQISWPFSRIMTRTINTFAVRFKDYDNVKNSFKLKEQYFNLMNLLMCWTSHWWILLETWV